LNFLSLAFEDFGREAGGCDFDPGEIIVGDDFCFVGDLEAANCSAIDGSGELEVFFVGMRVGPEEGA
jgi:hypothetical protein